MTPNRYAAVVDEEKCNGCKKCESRCYFEAIEFIPVNDSKKVKARVIPENCKGCGLCIITCKTNALRYEIVRPPEYLKPKPPEDGKEEEAPQFPVWGHYFLK
jgi:NAD-dependent dihydropyrimidine dehydrogenase PreA subunit